MNFLTLISAVKFFAIMTSLLGDAQKSAEGLISYTLLKDFMAVF